MPEILTESFCERCGTRYTFESAAPKAARLKGIKVLSRGLKNFVLSDDSSIDEAMAAARSETDRELTSFQLDAFHKTFNFCMTCRQYTCGNCWNETEGSCLSCTPHLGHEILPTPFPDLDRNAGLLALNGTNGANGTNGVHGANGANGHAPADEQGPMSWPTSDLMQEAGSAEPTTSTTTDAILDDGAGIDPVDMATRLASLDRLADAPVEPAPDLPTPDAMVPEAPVADPIAPEFAAGAVIGIHEAIGASDTTAPMSDAAATEPAADLADLPDVGEPVEQPAESIVSPAVEMAAAETPAPDVAVDPDDVAQRAAAAAGQTNALLHRFRPGQNLDDEIAAFEREQLVAAVPTEAAPSAAAATVVEEVVDVPPLAAVEAAPAGSVDAPAVEIPQEPATVAEVDVPPIAVVAAVAIASDVAEDTPAEMEAAAEAPVAEPISPVTEPISAPTETVEVEVAGAAAEPVEEPILAVEEPVATVEEPIAAVEESVPEVAAAEAPVADTPRVDIVEQPTWRIMAPESPTEAAAPVAPTPREAPVPPVAPIPPVEPQWPAQPEWPSQRPAAGLAGRQAQAGGSLESLWEESAREVAALPLVTSARPAATVAPCVNCGLSLSASARFCRRCGTRQG